MATDKPEDDPVIAEWRRRNQEFKRPWALNFALIFAPGFILFGLTWDNDLNRPSLMWVALGLVAVACVRGARIISRHMRCPECDEVQWEFVVSFPHLSCHSCGARLTLGVRDQL